MNQVWCYDIVGMSCCSSCHSEWDYEVADPMENEVSPRTMYYHCCQDGKEPTRSQIAAGLWKRRVEHRQTIAERAGGGVKCDKCAGFGATNSYGKRLVDGMTANEICLLCEGTGNIPPTTEKTIVPQGQELAALGILADTERADGSKNG